jgi:hypothetical protein
MPAAASPAKAAQRWSVVRTTLLRRRWVESVCAQQIAVELGVSRCAVVSKASGRHGRLGGTAAPPAEPLSRPAVSAALAWPSAAA